MLTSDLCDYGDPYIIMKGAIDHLPDQNASMVQKDVFKNNVSFESCISKINSTWIDSAEDLDIFFPYSHSG